EEGPRTGRNLTDEATHPHVQRKGAAAAGQIVEGPHVLTRDARGTMPTQRTAGRLPSRAGQQHVAVRGGSELVHAELLPMGQQRKQTRRTHPGLLNLVLSPPGRDSEV